MKKCDSCGKLYQENKDVFCPHCGAVAQKQCTHGSSFDSGRYNRDEIYQNNNTQYTAYTQGVEPHAQREKYPYNRFEDTFGDAGQYADETPRVKAFPDFSKTKNNEKNKIKTGIIIFICILAFNFLAGIFSFSDDVSDSDYWDFEDVSEVYVNENEFYPVSSSASIKLIGEENDCKVFELLIEDAYFPYETVNQSTEIKDYIVDGDMFVEAQICTFSHTEIPEIVYSIAVDESYCISAKNGEYAGHYIFEYDFDYGEIVNFSSGVSMYLENGMYVNVELPFGAFSISEDGEVTYYTSYADDSTEWNMVFTECSNEMTVSDYDVCIVLNDEE